MAASAVFCLVVQKYEHLLDEATDTNTRLISGLNSSIKQQIMDELRAAKLFLVKEEEVSNSISQLLNSAYDLEDVLDTYLLEELRHSSMNTSGVFIFSLSLRYDCINPFLKATADSRQLEKNLKKILTRMSDRKHMMPVESSAAADHDTYGLPSHLMGCLLYVAMFPKAMAIPVRRLLRLWIAEGFVTNQPGGGQDETCLEDLAMEYLSDLEARGFIRTTEKSCCLCGEWYNKLSIQAEKFGFLHIHKGITSSPPPPSPTFPVRRVVEYANISDYPQSESYVKSLRSYVSFNFQKKDTEAAQIGEFVGRITLKRGYSLLKVLDLERVYKPALPDKIGNLYNLRYLGLRWTFLDALPSSVQNLTLLQTLDLKHTYINKLPIQLHKMRELRHVYLNEIPLPGVLPAINLTNCMQTLSGWFVNEEEMTLTTQHFSNLKKLGLTCRSSCSKALGLWITTALTQLRYLKLMSKEDGKPSSLDLESLVSLERLEKIYLIGKIPKLEKQRFEFPCNVRVLTLSFSILEEDPMPMLGGLPHLVVLRLLAESYTGTRLFIPQDGFSSLRVLKLWGLRNLEEWMVGQGAMKSLQELEIRLCEKLESIPTRLLNAIEFNQLSLTHMPRMPDSVVADVEDYFERKERSSRQTHNWELLVQP